MFRIFIEGENLTICTPGKHMTYSYGIGSSQIDYILSTTEIPAKFVLCDTLEGNTSSHIPIRCVFKLQFSTCALKEVKRRLYRTLWNSCDGCLFREIINSSPIPRIQTKSDIAASIAGLQEKLLSAEACAVDKKQIRLQGLIGRQPLLSEQSLLRGDTFLGSGLVQANAVQNIICLLSWQPLNASCVKPSVRKVLLNDTHSITVFWSLKALHTSIVLSTEIPKVHNLPW